MVSKAHGKKRLLQKAADGSRGWSKERADEGAPGKTGRPHEPAGAGLALCKPGTPLSVLPQLSGTGIPSGEGAQAGGVPTTERGHLFPHLYTTTPQAACESRLRT